MTQHEENDNVDMDSARRDLRTGDHLVHSGLPEEQGRAAERLAVLNPAPSTNVACTVDDLATAFQDGFTGGNGVWSKTPELHREMFREGVRRLLAARPAPSTSADNIDRCPICAEPFKPEDICATDITEGTCHAAYLDGSPVVDLDTGDELPGGKIDTYPYSEVTDPAPQTSLGGAELLATVKEFARWHHLNELTIYTGGKPSDSEIDFEATAWNTIKRALATSTEGREP